MNANKIRDSVAAATGGVIAGVCVCVCVCVMAMMIMKLFDRLVMMWIVVVTVGLYVAKVSILQELAESMGGRFSQIEPACYTGHTFLFTHY